MGGFAATEGPTRFTLLVLRHDKTPSPRFWATGSCHVVELPGIEPGSYGAESGLLRVQFVYRFSRPRRSDERVADRPSRRKVPITRCDAV
jgi:hypothetical protein